MLGFALLPTIWARADSPQASGWFVTRSPHFELYSQADAGNSRKTLATFEQLRAFFNGNKVLPATARLATASGLRIIIFPSAKEYSAFRLRPNADAYYASSEDREYIVMAEPQSQDLAIDAHEYTHSVLHAAGLKLPAWLDEGLSEFFSTVRITRVGCRVGGSLPNRIDALTHHKWLPMAQLLTLQEAMPPFQTRDGMEIFYAESWALTDLLIGSPEYAPDFGELLTKLNAGVPSARAFAAIYGKSIDVVTNDLQVWVRDRRFTTREFPALPSTGSAVEVSKLSDLQFKGVLAELLLTDGELDRAKSLYTELAREDPGNPSALAAVGTIDLHQGNRAEAIQQWRRAIDNGLSNAGLCYRYAVLIEEAGLPADEMRRALKRAVTLDPSFDDARYKLALLDSNSGDFAAAIEQLRAMRTVSHDRAYGYWSALSYAYMELNERDEAKQAGEKAETFAQTASDRSRAAQLVYVAETDVVEQFVKDADGRSRLAETRVPHGTTEWNPFIEPTDQMQKAAGQLREVLCAGGKLTGFLVGTADGRRLTLVVPDPQHVLMRNGPAEFSCGPQQPKPVTVEYAAASKDECILRGITFP